MSPGSKRRRRELWSAVRDGDTAAVKRRMAEGSIPVGECVNHQGWTLVHEAVSNGHSGVMLSLAAKLVGDVNRAKKNGLTPAHVAASNNDPFMLLALQQLGADLRLLGDRSKLFELKTKTAAQAEDLRRMEVARQRSRDMNEIVIRELRNELESTKNDLAQRESRSSDDSKTLLEIKKLVDATGAANVINGTESQSEASEERKCSICYEREKTTAFQPCGHWCVCEECARRVLESTHKCPICNQQATSTQIIHNT